MEGDKIIEATHTLHGALEQFKQVCEELELDFRDRAEDIIFDVENDT